AAANGSQVNLAWADNANNEDGFKVYASSDGVHYTWVAAVGANATAYTWWGGSPGTTYSFYVTASNAAGHSAPSNTASVTPPAPPRPRRLHHALPMWRRPTAARSTWAGPTTPPTRTASRSTPPATGSTAPGSPRPAPTPPPTPGGAARRAPPTTSMSPPTTA